MESAPVDLADAIVEVLKAITTRHALRVNAVSVAQEASAVLDLPTLPDSLAGIHDQVTRGCPTQYARLLALLGHTRVFNWHGGLRYDARKAARGVVCDWVDAGEMEPTADVLEFHAEQEALAEKSAKARAEREAYEAEEAARAKKAEARKAAAPESYEAEDSVPSIRAAITRALSDRPGETANILYSRVRAPNQRRVGPQIREMRDEGLIETVRETSKFVRKAKAGERLELLYLADPLRGLGFSALARHESNVHKLSAPAIRKRVGRGMRPSEALAKPPTPSDDGRGGRRRGPSAA